VFAAALLLASSPAVAAPKGAQAKAAFERGVTAYQKQDYAGAAEALGKSFALEADVETLYAWAQAERQQDHCSKAMELYEKILKFDMPDENKKVVRGKLDECKAIIAAQKPPPPPVEPPPVKADPDPPPVVDKPEPPPVTPGARAWWKDPVGDSLVGLGVVGLGVGGYFLLAGSKANSDAAAANNYFDFERLSNKADSDGKIGIIGTACGGALLVTGIVWFATHRGKPHKAETAVTGFVAPSGGGLAAFGRW
jgi:tetratricopeptide (TPR) repeat protein